MSPGGPFPLRIFLGGRCWMLQPDTRKGNPGEGKGRAAGQNSQIFPLKVAIPFSQCSNPEPLPGTPLNPAQTKPCCGEAEILGKSSLAGSNPAHCRFPSPRGHLSAQAAPAQPEHSKDCSPVFLPRRWGKVQQHREFPFLQLHLEQQDHTGGVRRTLQERSEPCSKKFLPHPTPPPAGSGHPRAAGSS